MTEELPSGWVRATLGELGVQAQPGFASGKHNSAGKGVLHLRPMNISREGQITTADSRYVEDDSDRRVQAGDVLFNNTNSPALTGKTALVTSPEPVAYSNHMTRLRSPDGIDPSYLAAQLHWLWEIGYFKSVLNNHVNQASVATKQLLETYIIVAPMAEQRRIVAALDEQLSRLDAAHELLGPIRNRTRRLVENLTSRAASGALESSPHASTHNESHKLLAGRSSQKFSYTSLEALPVQWNWRVASEVCTHISSGATPEAKLMYADSGDVPFLKVYNITQDGVVDFTIRPTFVDEETHRGKLHRSRVLPGDVLTNIVGPPLGKTAVVPDIFPEWNINQAIVAFRAGPEILPEWLALLLRSPFIVDKLKATARATAGQFNIALSTCRDLPLPVPPLDEQRRIVDILVDLRISTDRACKAAAHLVQQSVGLRHSLLSAAFSGKLVAQDPADEPASVLLERIRSERASVAPGKWPSPRARRSTPAPKQTAPVPAGIQEELPL